MLGSRPRILSRTLLLVFGAGLGALTSFYLLLSVVPLYATSAGAGGNVAGLTTAALMFSTMAAELAVPRLVARFGYRLMLAAGLLLLGAPALALTTSARMAAILAVCVVRGLGFAVVVVVGGALVASLVPHERRGEGLGLYGVVVGIPALVALPLGVWLAGRVGYPPVFVAAAVAALAALAAVPGLPALAPAPEPERAVERQRVPEPGAGPAGAPGAGPDPGPGPEQPLGVLAGLRMPALLRPSVVFLAVTMAAGIVVTFLPLAVQGASRNLAAAALLVQAVAATVSRWWAGRYGDRHGSAGLLVSGVAAAGVGMLTLVSIGSAAAVVAGMALFGAGFGIAQNASMAQMFGRVSTSRYATVSALWNLAYDAGVGLGAAWFGAVAAQTGYPTAFALTAALVLAALLPAWHDRAIAPDRPAAPP
jgi:predicted MFS family arabinose efflux permease